MKILFLAACVFALHQAEPTRYRAPSVSSRLNTFTPRRVVLARQEAAATPAAVTPYPSADELKPEIPFNEVENRINPDDDDDVNDDDDTGSSPHQPDEVYGPPIADDDDDGEIAEDDFALRQPDEVYGPPEAVDELDLEVGQDETASSRQPDEIYGPPEQDEGDESDLFNVEEQVPQQQQDEKFAPEPITEEPQLGRLVFGRRISTRRTAARPAKLLQGGQRPAGLRTALRTRSRRQSQKLLRRQITARPVLVYQRW